MTYERVVVSLKATGPDPERHTAVEVAWWNLASRERGVFVPAHHVHNALSGCDIDTITANGYLDRLAKAPQDTDGTEAYRLAEQLQGAVLVSMTPGNDERMLRKLFDHYLNDFEFPNLALYQPEWHDVLDLTSYAAGVLGIPNLPDLPAICQVVGVPLEAARTADSDADAIGRCTMRLIELAEDRGGRTDYAGVVPATTELRDAYEQSLPRMDYDLVDFDQEDPNTYRVNYKVLADHAHQIYAPALAASAEQTGLANQQLRECIQAAHSAANQWQAKVDSLTTELTAARTIAPDDTVRAAAARTLAEFMGGPDGGENYDRGVDQVLWQDAIDAVWPTLRPEAAAHQAEINQLQHELEATRTKLAETIADNNQLADALREVQASRQAWATEASDVEHALRQGTPWDAFEGTPETELAVGPTTGAVSETNGHVADSNGHQDTPHAVAVGPDATVIGPAAHADAVHDIAATPAAVLFRYLADDEIRALTLANEIAALTLATDQEPADHAPAETDQPASQPPASDQPAGDQDPVELAIDCEIGTHHQPASQAPAPTEATADA